MWPMGLLFREVMCSFFWGGGGGGGGVMTLFFQQIYMKLAFYSTLVKNFLQIGEFAIEFCQNIIYFQYCLHWFCSSGKAGIPTGSEKYERTEIKHGDKVFHKFQKQTAACPQQCVR